METKCYCPQCGVELEQGEYYYDYDSGELIVENCPECGCSGMIVETDKD